MHCFCFPNDKVQSWRTLRKAWIFIFVEHSKFFCLFVWRNLRTQNIPSVETRNVFWSNHLVDNGERKNMLISSVSSIIPSLFYCSPLISGLVTPATCCTSHTPSTPLSLSLGFRCFYYLDCIPPISHMANLSSLLQVLQYHLGEAFFNHLF